MTTATVYGHSFIVRVWLEETGHEAVRTAWRGRVTHVPSHEQRYFENMQDLVSFVQRYLQGWEGGSDSDQPHSIHE